MYGNLARRPLPQVRRVFDRFGATGPPG